MSYVREVEVTCAKCFIIGKVLSIVWEMYQESWLWVGNGGAI